MPHHFHCDKTVLTFIILLQKQWPCKTCVLEAHCWWMRPNFEAQIDWQLLLSWLITISHKFLWFVQSYCIEKQKPLHYTNNGNIWLWTFVMCSFKQEHQLSKTHEIQILILGMVLKFFTTCCRIISSSCSNFFWVLFISLC